MSTQQKRVYDDGRPTDGWKRGKRVNSVSEVKVGQFVICVHHQNKTENLFKVVEPTNGDSPNNPNLFHAQPCAPDGTFLVSENILAVWNHDLNHPKLQEWHIGERNGPIPKHPTVKNSPPNTPPAAATAANVPPEANGTTAPNAPPAAALNEPPAEPAPVAAAPSAKKTPAKGNKGDAERMAEAKKINKEQSEEDALFWLNINASGDPEIGSFTNADFEEEEEDEAEEQRRDEKRGLYPQHEDPTN
jgi:hypothetical protein